LTIHGTGNFLSWHRYYIYTFEEALRDECGYKGYLPYANWGRYAEDLLNSPIFDGSAYSISGNGEYRNHTGASIPSAALPLIQLPAGSGGGCITTGPFKNMTVNLGPVAPVFSDVPPNPQPDGLGYNPRCLRRDIGVYAASIASTDANSTDLIRQNSYIGDFQTVMQGDFAAGLLGVHTAGHFWYVSEGTVTTDQISPDCVLGCSDSPIALPSAVISNRESVAALQDRITISGGRTL
jgi:tyrosinase